MKRNIFLIFFVICLTLFSSCTTVPKETCIPKETDSEILFEVKQESYILLEKDLKECIEETLYIVEGYVSSIGDSRLEDGFSLPHTAADAAEMSKASVKTLSETIRQIYTPITFIPEKIYKSPKQNNTQTAFDSLSAEEDSFIALKGRYGTCQGYRFSPNSKRVLMEEGKNYILFLYINDGNIHVWHQPSLALASDGTFRSLMNNPDLYTDFKDAAEIRAYFSALSENES